MKNCSAYMSSATLVFPHQLFKNHPAVLPGRPVIIVEEWLFFSQYSFHKKKILFHRASMKAYQAYLKAQCYEVSYEERSDIRLLIEKLASDGVKEVCFAELTDNWLANRIRQRCKNLSIKAVEIPSPYFLNSLRDLDAQFKNRKTYFQTDFYKAQRKARRVLLDNKDQPLGGKWSFDDENRERFPKDHKGPDITWCPINGFVEEAITYTKLHFGSNPGTTANFGYPITFEDAEQWLDEFLAQRFKLFGNYEDAMVKTENFLHHSILSPMINTGLLEPQQVLDKTLKNAFANEIPLNSLEGFIRQILGWREFIRIIYHREGGKQRTRNFFGFTRKIPYSFWTGNTGIHPVDSVIQHTLNHSYTHHINRLMVIGNFMLLCEFDPDEVYRWFMEMYIDAYDWVMVPNIYGMSQFSDGGIMTTKPYISGSNYLMKMGNWEKGSWQQTWDALFWRFMHVHREVFAKNPRMNMLLKSFDKMSPEKRNLLLETAEHYLTRLDQPGM